MSFTSLLTHDLTHVRVPLDETDLDERGYPTEDTPVETAVKGLVQPLSGREMLDFRSAGTEIADHQIFLQMMELDPRDHFVFDGDRYDIETIETRRYGTVPHLEVRARRIGAASNTEGS